MSRLSLIAYEPVQEQGLYARQFVDDLTGNHEGYRHVVRAVGGFESANFRLLGTRDYLDGWFEDGLMRRVVLYNPQGVEVWEGFVNRLRYSIGTLQKTRSMDGMYNRVVQIYTPIVSEPEEPVIVDPPHDPIYDDAASVAEWGVKAVFVSGGEMTDEEAFAWGRAILRDKSQPAVGESVNTQATNPPFMDVECLGYYHTLKWMPFLPEETTCTVSAAEIQAHQAIQEILRFYSECVNTGWVSTDSSWMDYNFLSYRQRSNQKSCWDVIADIIRLGGAGGERWVGGLYQNRQMVYKPAEALDALYGEYMQLVRSLNDREQKIYDEQDVEVKPWDVLPDRILRTVDLLM